MTRICSRIAHETPARGTARSTSLPALFPGEEPDAYVCLHAASRTLRRTARARARRLGLEPPRTGGEACPHQVSTRPRSGARDWHGGGRRAARTTTTTPAAVIPSGTHEDRGRRATPPCGTSRTIRTRNLPAAVHPEDSPSRLPLPVPWCLRSCANGIAARVRSIRQTWDSANSGPGVSGRRGTRGTSTRARTTTATTLPERDAAGSRVGVTRMSTRGLDGGRYLALPRHVTPARTRSRDESSPQADGPGVTLPLPRPGTDTDTHPSARRRGRPAVGGLRREAGRDDQVRRHRVTLLRSEIRRRCGPLEPRHQSPDAPP